MSYNPSEYWHERGKKYKENFRYNKNFVLQEELLITYLSDNIFTSDESTTSVLELGCGYGRITNLLMTKFHNMIKEYLAVDLSPHQIENAKQYLRSNNNKITFAVSDIQSFDTNKKYNLVILSEVLLHVLPEEIESIIKKLITLSKKHIINVDWYENNLPRDYKIRATYNFIHQYEALYKKYTEPSTIIKRIPIKRKKFMSTVDTKQSIFHVILETNPN